MYINIYSVAKILIVRIWAELFVISDLDLDLYLKLIL